MEEIAWQWVVGGAGLALTAIGVWLTILYGQQSNARLQKICRRLGLERPDTSR